MSQEKVNAYKNEKKNRKKTVKKEKIKKKVIQIVTALLTVLVIGGFGYWIYYSVAIAPTQQEKSAEDLTKEITDLLNNMSQNSTSGNTVSYNALTQDVVAE